ncbi:cytochrome P450 [Polyplosphaeria fusca]|uniref:Cytochrome P450 n=1 Tax=Polyplosphaeria fusca TaxID=682080 RepID=A0A9P4V3U0_9PLEO|nr:cytochrome P450 [Polyplosphaeria fusca]
MGDLIRSKPLAAALGVASHFILGKGEWDHSSHLVALTWAGAFAAITTVEYLADPQVQSIFEALLVTVMASAVYFAALISVLLVYRAFFHRLRKFPGPFSARLSKFYGVSLAVRNFQLYNEIERLHKEYKADIIRTGPRELSVVTADAVPLVHGPLSKCTKGPWYNASKFLDGGSTHTTRDKKEHKERRKDWDRAFSTKSLREYEPRVNRHSQFLLERLKEKAHQPSVRISDWFNYFSFDIMGDVGFSRSFGMLEKGEEDDMIKLLHKSMEPASIFGHLNWAVILALRSGLGVGDMLKHMAWTAEALKERKKITPAEKDIFGFLLDPNDEGIPLRLNADARLLVVAGSDTTSATLTWLCYELCKHPEVQAKLRPLVDSISPEKSFLDAEEVANIPYLDGIIHEALRLHPAVPSGVQRETPAEGLTLPDQTYIPGNTIIWMPMHTMQRDERYFPSPLSFMPERWTDEKPEYIQDKRAFMPFSAGIYNCVGQKLSIMEMRVIVANLTRSFDVKFADGETGAACEKETRDCFTLNVGKLDVKLTPRYESKEHRA